MNLFAACGIGLGAMALLLAVVLSAPLRPLSASLAELCGAKERGDFWTALSGLSLTTGALLAGLLGFWLGQATPAGGPDPRSTGEAALFWSGVAMLRWVAVALLAGVILIASAVLAFTARLARGALPAPSTRPQN
jgi:hypothetical protein